MPRSTVDAAREIFAALPPLFKLLVVFAILNALLIAGITSMQPLVVRNTAIVKSIEVGVYWDASCATPLDENAMIDWGAIGPGENSTVVVYLKNEGNWRFTLFINATNWSSPEAEEFIKFTTDYEDQPVAVDEVIPVTFVLSVLPEIRDVLSFGFDIWIDADG